MIIITNINIQLKHTKMLAGSKFVCIVDYYAYIYLLSEKCNYGIK